MDIPGYSLYFLENGEILNKKTGKPITKSYRSSTSFAFFKLKNDEGIWKQVSEQKIQALVTIPEPPSGFVKVPTYERTYISSQGEVWVGPSEINPTGGFIKIQYRNGRYPVAASEGRKQGVHQMLGLAFLDSEYLTKGLVVMHLDDNKENFTLTNLKIGTYSENNKAAHESSLRRSTK